MSNTDEDKKFREVADAFIAVANKQSKNENPSMVNAAFLYAAARFNIFIVIGQHFLDLRISFDKIVFGRFTTRSYKQQTYRHNHH